MVEKVAVPFWLCWSAGMVIGAATGNYGFWLVVTGIAGLLLGFILRALAKRRVQRAFHATGKQQSRPPAVAAPPTKDVKRAA